MNKKLISFYICVIVLLILMVTILLKENDVKANFLNNSVIITEYKSEIRDILKKRTSIIEKYIFNDMSERTLEEELKKIEKGKVFANDISFLKEVTKNSDYPRVIDFKIDQIDIVHSEDNLYTFVVNIIWDLEYSDYEKVQVKYNLELLKENNSTYLTKFDVLK